MPVYSVRAIKAQRVWRSCCECRRHIPAGKPAIRLYGCADEGDKPSELFFHPHCLPATGPDAAKIAEAKAVLTTDNSPTQP